MPGDGNYLSGLGSFASRTCYANSSGDHLVGSRLNFSARLRSVRFISLICASVAPLSRLLRRGPESSATVCQYCGAPAGAVVLNCRALAMLSPGQANQQASRNTAWDRLWSPFYYDSVRKLEHICNPGALHRCHCRRCNCCEPQRIAVPQVSWANASLRYPEELPELSAPGRGVVREDPLQAGFSAHATLSPKKAAPSSPGDQHAKDSDSDCFVSASSAGSSAVSSQASDGRAETNGNAHRGAPCHVLWRRLQCLSPTGPGGGWWQCTGSRAR